MADVISLEIETNLCEFPYEKRFPSSLKLIDFKKKLELVVGAEAANISLKLLDPDGRLVKTLIGDESTLQELGVRSGMRVCAVDISGMNEEINDDSMFEKYEMSEDAYDERQDSVRAWKKRLLAEKPAVAEQHRDDPNEDAAKSIKVSKGMFALKAIQVGERCEVLVKGQMARRGCIAFLGTTQFKPGIWVGVKYDEPLGKNDGSVEGVRYFSCDPKYGGFVRPVDVKCGDFPEEEIDEM